MNRILTYSGRHLDFRNPDPAEIAIGDIAVALSRACRFSGQCRLFYSVAQHSVLVSLIVPAEHALEALLHDATEAWLGDVSTPLKALLPEYVRIEKKLDRVVRRKFGLPEEMSGPVHRADRVLLATEKRDLMPEDTDKWPVLEGVSPLPGSVLPWTENSAREVFLERWARLTGGGRDAVERVRIGVDGESFRKGEEEGREGRESRIPPGFDPFPYLSGFVEGAAVRDPGKERGER